MTITKAKSKKVANVTFLIVTNKVSTQEGLSVIEAARQNVLATFPLKSSSKKLPLAASVSVSSLLAGSSSPVKVPSKRHIRTSFTTSTTTTTTISASQMATKAKNSKKQQQTVTTAMVTLNFFVVPDEILGKISTAAASPFPDIDGNGNGSTPNFINSDDLKDWADQIEMELFTPPPVSGVINGNVWMNVNGRQRFSRWVAFTLSVSRNAVKLFCVKFASQKSLNGATKVAISDKVFLTTFKIARSSDVVSVSSPFLSVALHDISLGISFNDIKTALGIFGVVTSVKLKPAGLWQYAVVNFKDISSIAAALSNWSVLVRKDSVRILPVANQKEVIFTKDAFKAKLVNLPFGCTVFEISNLVFQVGGRTCFISYSPEFY
ncbi:hypothetical protein G9A89_009325 [Geosiphon pyriformis]|nr:hypothetical protein G9A89_009325 [Geosiphon pyriformis]